jgi:precorrin-2 dehydrogenase/sirohydrochlorin ferrochelatase
VTLRRRPFRSGDLAGVVLAIAATDDPSVNAAVSRQARRRGIWVNVVDAPEFCTAIAPAIVQRGALTIAISTGGASPAVASAIRRQLERRYGTAYAPYLELLRAARGRVQARVPDPKRRAAIMHRLQRLDLLRWLRRCQPRRARRLLDDAVERAIRPAPRKRAGRHDVL